MEMLQKCERYFTPIGRIIVGAYFLLSGLGKLMDISGTAGYIESVGLPAGMLLAVAAIVIEMGAGGALLVGYKSKYAALVLAGFVFVVSFPFHGPQLWADQPMQQVSFMKNMGLFGALLFMGAHIGSPCCLPNHKHSEPEEQQTPTPTL